MKRVGAKNKPAFRIVVADGRSPRDGRFIEELGTYLPQGKEPKFTLEPRAGQVLAEQGRTAERDRRQLYQESH